MKVLSSVVVSASLVVSVQAHGYISKPKASYQPNTIYTTYNELTSASINKGFDGGHYNWSPTQNAQAFTDHWDATGYKSLRDMVDPIVPDYGFSLETADPVDVTGYTEMWWQNDEYKEGFIASHEGPCEAWIDDTMVFHHDNCAAQFKSYPAKVPTDYSSCKGDCLFVFYWLALHEPDWQIYKQCVPITNSGSGTSKQTTTSDEASSTEDNGDSTQTQASNTGQTDASTANEASSDAAPESPEATPTPESQEATPAPESPEATPAPEATPGSPDPAPGTPNSPDATYAPQATTAPAATPAPETPEAPAADTTSGKCVRRH
ncbi:hypothetical protein PHYBOEH_008765 [Phytophthora boehmeriae]|uniref:Uncharacterized protein n=1 Tax=Phytophthora boehmeriae TaxID=109152 RepID=A0A8T1VYD0_9STRA|nr:hypothetical protein PHYBOEH_008765 [Phytophthora boehmeriae]